MRGRTIRGCKIHNAKGKKNNVMIYGILKTQTVSELSRGALEHACPASYVVTFRNTATNISR